MHGAAVRARIFLRPKAAAGFDRLPDGRPSLIEKNAAPGTHPYRSVDGLMPGLITTMLELVALTQTAPVETLRTMHAGPGAAQFAFGGWRLVHNQLHEQPTAPYNACAVRGHMP